MGSAAGAHPAEATSGERPSGIRHRGNGHPGSSAPDEVRGHTRHRPPFRSRPSLHVPRPGHFVDPLMDRVVSVCLCDQGVIGAGAELKV